MYIALGIAGCVVLVFVALVAWALLRPGARVGRELRGLPLKPLAEVSDGEWVRIMGVVRAEGGTVRSPATGREAVAWQLSAGYHSEEGGNVGPVEAEQVLDFVVEDETSSLRVPAGPALRLELDTGGELVRVVAKDAPEVVLDRLEPSVPAVRRDRYGTIGIEEGVLEPGERVTVGGIVRVRMDGDGRRVVLEPHPEHGLLVSDRWAATQ